MPNIASFFGLLEKLESTDLAVHQNRCIVVRNRNAACRKCVEACTSGALSLERNELVVTPEKCVGCGTCATVCPTCALEACNPSDAELAQRCLAALGTAEGEAVIVCDQMLKAAEGLYDPEKVVGVACLGRVEESLLTFLALHGAKRITLVKAACAACDHVVGWRTADLVVETENTLLAAWNQVVNVRVNDKLPGCVRKADKIAYDHAKREFLHGLKGDAKTAAATAADFALESELGIKRQAEPRLQRVASDGTLPHFVPARRGRLLDALAALGTPDDEMIETRLWGQVIIDTAACSSCRMCATFCPTGAIRKIDEPDGTIGVEHFPGDCVKCRCCVDICPEGALVLSDEVFARDLMEGRTERFPMGAPAHVGLGPHAMLNSMRGLMGGTQIYER